MTEEDRSRLIQNISIDLKRIDHHMYMDVGKFVIMDRTVMQRVRDDLDYILNNVLVKED